MATAETLGFSPEQQRVYGQIAGFFGRAESEFPAAAHEFNPAIAAGRMSRDKFPNLREEPE